MLYFVWFRWQAITSVALYLYMIAKIDSAAINVGLFNFIILSKRIEDYNNSFQIT